MVSKVCMEVVRHSCVLLCHHSILPESYYQGHTILMSKLQRRHFLPWASGEVGGNWVGSKHNHHFAPSSVSRADWTRQREYAPSGKGWLHTPSLCNAAAQGKCDSEDCLWLIISFWAPSELVKFCPILGTTNSISAYILKCAKFKSPHFVRDIIQIVFYWALLCSNKAGLMYFILTKKTTHPLQVMLKRNPVGVVSVFSGMSVLSCYTSKMIPYPCTGGLSVTHVENRAVNHVKLTGLPLSAGHNPAGLLRAGSARPRRDLQRISRETRPGRY